MTPNSGIEIKTVGDRRTVRDWLNVPVSALACEPVWIQPLDLAERQRISPKNNAFFANGEAAFFLAYRNGEPVGRISAQVNRSHLELHRDTTGHFGFFDCIDDADVANALVGAAAAWLRTRGMARMTGPFSLSINQESGVLVSGFEHRPALMTPYANIWTGKLLEQSGLTKEMDLLSYRMRPALVPPHIDRLSRLARSGGRVSIRNIDMKRYSEEAALIFDIFNDAWSDNWGFVPISGHEAKALASELRLLMRSKFGWIAEVDGEPAAMMIVLPDINEVIGPFHGRLLPFNWAKLAYAVWRDDWRTARVPLLGIRKKFRNSPLGTGILSMLIANILELGRQYSIDWIEFSWVLETNPQMIALAEVAAGPPSTVHRIYGKDLDQRP